MRLKFYGKFGTFEMLQASAVIDSALKKSIGEEPKIKPDVFKNKIVLVGVNFPGMDLKHTSVDRQLPGVFVHATALSNILANDYLKKIPGIYVLLMNLLYIPLCCFTTRFIKPTFLFASLLLRVPFVAFFILHGIIALFCFKNNLWIMIFPQWFTILFTYISILITSYIYEGRMGRMIYKTFQSYVSPKVVKKIVTRADKLPMLGERKILTVMILDLEGFTSLAETMDPEQAVSHLKKCFNVVHEQVFKFDGVLDKFIGDGVLCFWGDPDEIPDHAARTCYCAIAIQNGLKQMNVKARIGINTGQMVVGKMGSDALGNYTVIGDEVNLAARLEGANKFFETRIMISSRTYDVAKDEIQAREIGLIRVKGRHKAERVYELLGFRTGPFDDFLKIYNEALNYFKARDFASARDAFTKAGKMNHDDKVCNLYIKLCNEFIASENFPVGEYVHELTEK